jgi:putative (di)nucleoside polyphosphate hydrolase
MDKENLPYRPCAGIMLLNHDNKVFVGRRIDQTMEAWQMPQGGIDEGEEVKTAALRELEEEIGTSKVEIIARTPGWLRYDLPDELIGKVWEGKYRGQKQKWYLMRFLGEDTEINLDTHHPEFSAWKWVDIEEVPKMIVPFKRELYFAVLKEFEEHLAD